MRGRGSAAVLFPMLLQRSNDSFLLSERIFDFFIDSENPFLIAALQDLCFLMGQRREFSEMVLSQILEPLPCFAHCWFHH